MDILVTNNILVKTNYESRFKVDYSDCSLQEVLTLVRNYVHKGHILLTHPLSGSVKPNETPYKSVLVSGEKGKVDLQSVQIAEESIFAAKKFAYRHIQERYLPDLREVDFTLISSAIANL